MEKRLGLISDIILIGYVLEGVKYVFDWSVVLAWIAIGAALIAFVMSVMSALKTRCKTETRGKWLKKSIYYIILSVLLIIICLYRGLNLGI